MPLDIQSWTRRRKCLAMLGVMLFLGATLYGLPSSSRHTNAMDINTAIHSPHTLCVGRYLIDVPADYKLEHYDYRVNGVSISWISQAADAAGFDAALAERKNQLGGQKNEYGKPSLEEPMDILLEGMRAVVLPYGRSPPVEWTQGGKTVRSDEFLTAEAWLWTGTHAIQLLADNMPGDAKGAVIQLLQRIKRLDSQSTPSEEGFCMDMFDVRAMLLGPPDATHSSEGAEIQFGLKDRPDVKFRLAFYPNSDKLSEPLRERHARANAAMSSVQWRFSTLREKQRSVGPMDGYEIIEAAREENFTRGLGFDWEWLGRPNDPLAPEIHLEAKTGYSRNGPVGSSLSDKDALKLWDMVTGSIRLRPTSAPPKAVNPAAINVSLGALAATGRTCPQTGWWECVDAGVVAGSERRHIREGERMPRVAMVDKPTLLQKLQGKQPIHNAPTMWRLADYGELPPPPRPPLDVPDAHQAGSPEGDA